MIGSIGKESMRMIVKKIWKESGIEVYSKIYTNIVTDFAVICSI
jgi:hypothetical protein